MWQDFKPVLKILLRFVLIYVLLIFVYQQYLNFYDAAAVDPFTRLVANEACFVQGKLGYPSGLTDDVKHNSLWFFVKIKYVSRMVEGCNAVSIMILFLAFIFAFYRGWKTFVFAAGGLLFIHVVNFLRIALLNLILLNYPQYGEIGHQYLFPAIIYGSIVILWLIWVKFFVLKETGV